MNAARSATRPRLLLTAGSLLFGAGFIIWPGCVSAPLVPSRAPAGNLQKQDVKFSKTARLTRQDITAKLGQPDFWFADLNVAAYRLNKVSRSRLVLLFGVVPLAVDDDNPGLEVALIQYDPSGIKLRQTRRTVREPYSMIGTMISGPQHDPAFEALVREAATAWVRPGSKR
jgi:hypothetical protein